MEIKAVICSKYILTGVATSVGGLQIYLMPCGSSIQTVHDQPKFDESAISTIKYHKFPV
jgi:hypothetical protein